MLRVNRIIVIKYQVCEYFLFGMIRTYERIFCCTSLFVTRDLFLDYL